STSSSAQQHPIFSVVTIQPPAPSTLFPYTTLFRSTAERTGQSRERIAQDSERDCFWSAADAVQYGFCDRVIDDLSQILPLWPVRSEEHTSELQSRFDLVCRLLLEKKKKYT